MDIKNTILGLLFLLAAIYVMYTSGKQQQQLQDSNTYTQQVQKQQPSEQKIPSAVVESSQADSAPEEIPETADSLEGNALQKAQYIHQKFNVDCFADDTGLEVSALDNRPGVFSARYANMPDNFEETGLASPESLQMPDPTFDQNIDRLLFKLQNKPRQARFRSVICLILNEETYYFEGSVNGIILNERHGNQGFGYDPVFQPNGFEKSFAELNVEEKNAISHRGKAIQALISFLEKR